MSDTPTAATHHGMSPTALYYILDHTIWFSYKSIILQCQWTDCPAKMKIPMPMESLVLYIFPS